MRRRAALFDDTPRLRGAAARQPARLLQREFVTRLRRIRLLPDMTRTLLVTAKVSANHPFNVYRLSCVVPGNLCNLPRALPAADEPRRAITRPVGGKFSP